MALAFVFNWAQRCLGMKWSVSFARPGMGGGPEEHYDAVRRLPIAHRVAPSATLIAAPLLFCGLSAVPIGHATFVLIGHRDQRSSGVFCSSCEHPLGHVFQIGGDDRGPVTFDIKVINKKWQTNRASNQSARYVLSEYRYQCLGTCTTYWPRYRNGLQEVLIRQVARQVQRG